MNTSEISEDQQMQAAEREVRQLFQQVSREIPLILFTPRLATKRTGPTCRPE